MVSSAQLIATVMSGDVPAAAMPCTDTAWPGPMTTLTEDYRIPAPAPDPDPDPGLALA